MTANPGKAATRPARLFIPGPVDVPEDAQIAQLAPMIGHRSQAMDDLFAAVQGKLRDVFCTRERVYLLASSGTGLHEACIRNGVRAPETGAHVLFLVCGAFGQRWHDVGVGCGKTAIKVEKPWFQAFAPDEVRQAVADANQDGKLDAVCMVHNETSTGVLQPVAELAAAIRSVAPQALIFVDAVSSLAGAEVRMDDWGLDVCLTSSQKALATPPGLALAAVSDRTLERATQVTGRGWYFDFLNLEAYLLRGTTPATPAVATVQALNVQLDRILAEGLENRWARHITLRDYTRDTACALGFAPCIDIACASPTVTTLRNTRQVDVGQLNAHLAGDDMEIANGYGPEKGKSLRIGHMGEMNIQDLERLFGAVRVFLA